MPLWYAVRAGEIWAWTYAKSQKVRNLERDARATLQVEDGSEYQELSGVVVGETPRWWWSRERTAGRFLDQPATSSLACATDE